jgi:hypothetical protein
MACLTSVRKGRFPVWEPRRSMTNNDFLLEHLHCHYDWHPQLEKFRHYLLFCELIKICIICHSLGNVWPRREDSQRQKEINVSEFAVWRIWEDKYPTENMILIRPVNDMFFIFLHPVVL